ncbi:NAD(P)-binding protein [Aspergillus varians]
MPSYVITGASRGLGFEFVRQLAADSNNTVIGLVRNKAAADDKAKAQGLTAAHFVEAQYTDLASLKSAAEVVKKITGGELNVLINNAANVSEISELRTLGDFHDDFDKMEADLKDTFDVNVLGVIKTVEAFIPLIQAADKSSVKKVITISSGMSDLELINSAEVAVSAPYAISKGALNVAIAKYNALYKSEGILFMAICPGYVATERATHDIVGEDDKARYADLGAKFLSFAPHFTGMMTPQEAVATVLGLADKSSIENGDGGTFVSHHGNKQWF